MRAFFKYMTSSKKEFYTKLLLRASDWENFCFLGDGEEEFKVDSYNGFNMNAGVGCSREVMFMNDTCDVFHALNEFFFHNLDFKIGLLNYDLKNQIEKLSSENQDVLSMPLVHFFCPELIFMSSEIEGEIRIGYFPYKYSAEQISEICKEIEATEITDKTSESDIVLQSRVSESEYIETVKKIKEHIQYGDVYELNYCIEFFAENVNIDPIEVYRRLCEISSAPFSCFYKVDNKYLISASPERFLKKEKNRIVAQPMKGTARREEGADDVQAKNDLKNNEKERAENVMIVDLVRNDLSKTAKKNSVQVDELFGVYSFPQVHQMVSTISSDMRDDVHIIDVIKSAFPMGSMTGAPKVKAMELIEKYEVTKRGLFSGSVGYITPENDFDFNVVIRSIQFNADKKYLSFMVGSAITINSDPQKEYEECLLKAEALIQALK